MPSPKSHVLTSVLEAVDELLISASLLDYDHGIHWYLDAAEDVLCHLSPRYANHPEVDVRREDIAAQCEICLMMEEERGMKQGKRHSCSSPMDPDPAFDPFWEFAPSGGRRRRRRHSWAHLRQAPAPDPVLGRRDDPLNQPAAESELSPVPVGSVLGSCFTIQRAREGATSATADNILPPGDKQVQVHFPSNNSDLSCLTPGGEAQGSQLPEFLSPAVAICIKPAASVSPPAERSSASVPRHRTRGRPAALGNIPALQPCFGQSRTDCSEEPEPTRERPQGSSGMQPESAGPGSSAPTPYGLLAWTPAREDPAAETIRPAVEPDTAEWEPDDEFLLEPGSAKSWTAPESECRQVLFLIFLYGVLEHFCLPHGEASEGQPAAAPKLVSLGSGAAGGTDPGPLLFSEHLHSVTGPEPVKVTGLGVPGSEMEVVTGAVLTQSGSDAWVEVTQSGSNVGAAVSQSGPVLTQSGSDEVQWGSSAGAAATQSGFEGVQVFGCPPFRSHQLGAISGFCLADRRSPVLSFSD
ncbi:uncharacterized protein KZ484_000340 [Pholidichthys leucotaenia]